MQTIESLGELEQKVTELQAAGRAVFVRYSRSPAGDCRRGHSTNHVTGQPELGLSCNSLACPAWWPVNRRTVRGWLAMQVSDYRFMLRQGGQGTKAWILTGREVGRGSDNEALVAEAKPVAYLSQTLIEEAIAEDAAQ